MEQETSLLARARDGDPRAITELVERYAPRLLRFGMKLCKNEEDAREVMQDTLATAARELSSFRGHSRFATWLFTIARNYCIRRRTRGAGKALLEPLEDREYLDVEHTASRPPDEQLIGMQLEQALEFAIRDLPPPLREVLLLRDVEGLSAPEVSEVLGLSVDAVKSRLHRARSALRERLTPLSQEDRATHPTTCPNVVELLSRYQEGDVDAEACKKLEAHVASCPTCSVRCTSLRRVLAACSSAPAPELSPELRESVVKQIRRSLQRNQPGSSPIK